MVGDAINNASRMLSGAEDGSMVISKDFGEKYLNSDNVNLNDEITINNGFSFKLIDEDSVIDKHGFRHLVYGIIIYKNKKQFGKESKILNKYFTNIYSTDYPKKVRFSDFSERVSKCETLTLFGIYHPSTIKILESLKDVEDKNVVISIYYASDKLNTTIKEFFGSNEDKLDFKNKYKSQKEITDWYQNHSSKDKIELNIFEYEEFYPFGFSMVDHEIAQSGFIHFSNYIPKIIPEDTPYVEVEWKTNEMPPIYEFYYNYIKKNILKNCEYIRKIKL
jgi:hypothetical protein